jgi:hypothetical protein
MLLSLALVLMTSLDGDAAFAAGRASWDQLEYEQAVFRFQEVAIRSDLSLEDKATAFVWLGISYGSVGDAMAARRAFTDALRANPAQTLPVEVSPKIEHIFAEARAAMPAASETATTTGIVPAATPATAADDTMAIATASTGAVLVVASLGLGAISAATFAQASDPDAFQSDAKAAVDAANLELVAASVAISLGLALGGVAGFLFAQPGPEGVQGH